MNRVFSLFRNMVRQTDDKKCHFCPKTAGGLTNKPIGPILLAFGGLVSSGRPGKEPIPVTEEHCLGINVWNGLIVLLLGGAAALGIRRAGRHKAAGCTGDCAACACACIRRKKAQ